MTTRRAKGSGSVRQLTKNSYEVRYDGPPDADGKATKISETIRSSKRHAERVLRERLGAVDTGSYVTRQRETVAANAVWTTTMAR